MTKKETNIYMAGLVDGEGSVMLLNSNRGRFRVPTVSVATTTYEIIQFLEKNYAGVTCQKKLYKKHHKQSWSWTVRYNHAIDLLKKIYPYLLEPNKKYRANIIIKEYKKVTMRNGKYNKSQLKMKLEFEAKFLLG